MLTRLKFGQTVRDDGPKTHYKKTGTPTMGGMIFLIPVTVLAAFYAGHDRRILPLIFVTLGFGLIGFIDDFIKVVKKRKDGLYWNQKNVRSSFGGCHFCRLICLIPILRTSLFLLWEWIKRCRWDGCLSILLCLF